MQRRKFGAVEIAGCVMILLMVALQFAYAVYAYLDPAAFSDVRGTELFAANDVDWIRVYASRTLFIALIIGFLLYSKNFKVLAMASLLGIVMPVTDALLAYQAHAADKVVLKHVATAVFLMLTFAVLQVAAKRSGEKEVGS